MLHLTLYNYNNANVRIDKSTYLTGGTALTGDEVMPNQSLLDLSVIISSSSAPTYNYCYIQEFNRYYFITNVSWLGGVGYELTLHVDVLMTYHTQIGNMYAMVDYSGSGKYYVADGRMPLNKDPIREEFDIPMSPTTYVNTIMLRYQWGSPVSDSLGIRCALLTPQCWLNFQTAYRALEEWKRVAIARQMLDVSVIRLPYENTNVSLSALPRSQYVQFWVENVGITGSQAGYLDVNIDPNNAGLRAFIVRNKADARVIQNIAFTIDDDVINDNANTTNADYKILIPHIGEYTYNLYKSGIFDANTFGIQIDFDPFGNSYYVTPVINIDLAGDFDYAQYDDIQNFPVTTTYAFAVDNEYNNVGWKNLTNGINGFLTGFGGLLKGNVIQYAAAPYQFKEQYERATLESAAGWQMKGSAGGSLTHLIGIDQNSISVEKLHFDYLGDIANYQIEFGMPDGETRSLGLMSGYYQVGKITMSGFSTATKDEVEEIENLLKAGVIA